MSAKSIVLMFACCVMHMDVFAQPDNLELFIRDLMKEKRIPGMQVAVIERGKIVFNKAFGIANLQDSIPANGQSIFAINSCTKVFTAVAIMQLVEAGKIRLDASVSTYLPDLPAEWQSVRIDQLMAHISGIPDISPVLDVTPQPFAADSKSREVIAWEKVRTMPMDFPTGERYWYNQTNYYLLGKIITSLTGTPFQENFRTHQFDVIGMPHTLFADRRDVVPHWAPTYAFRMNIDGPHPNESTLINFTAEFVSGLRTGSGLNSTATDIASWIIGLQHGKLLKTTGALNTMWSPIKFKDGTNTPVGLGWGVARFRPKHKAIGMSGGARSAFLIYPDDDLAFVVLTNLSGSNPENFIEDMAGYYNADIPNADPMTALRVQMRKMKTSSYKEAYTAIRKRNPAFSLMENDLNNLAYELMGQNRLTQATELLELNVSLYPNSWNVYDSYGEGLAKAGRNQEAIAAYKKSLQLNPDNDNGKLAIKNLSK